ncbi:hypothetical protein GCM10029978_074770 [Actinoallomurus acanthiterrae]
MARLRDLLERFRPAGAPGAAARTGVPADRATELAAELADVFATLEPVQAECTAIREAARRDARDARGRAHDQADTLIAEARMRVAAERAAAAARAGERVSAEYAAIVTDAEGIAAQIRARADERLPALVARAISVLKGQT